MAFLVGFFLFFLVIALTIIMGGVSRLDDKRIAREGHVAKKGIFTRNDLPV